LSQTHLEQPKKGLFLLNRRHFLVKGFPEMDFEKLQKAVEMAKNDVKILGNPSCKLYPILIRKLKHLVDQRFEHDDEQVEEKENDSAVLVKPAKAVKKPATIPKRQKFPLQPRAAEMNARAKVKVVDSIVKPSAAVTFSPRKSTSARQVLTDIIPPPKPKPQTQVSAYQPKKLAIPPHLSVSHDFVVPKLDSPNPTRTGLVQKSKKSDLESMRQESDDRLKIAMKHLVIARKV
jgi:hypothetical protein